MSTLTQIADLTDLVRSPRAALCQQLKVARSCRPGSSDSDRTAASTQRGSSLRGRIAGSSIAAGFGRFPDYGCPCHNGLGHPLAPGVWPDFGAIDIREMDDRRTISTEHAPRYQPWSPMSIDVVSDVYARTPVVEPATSSICQGPPVATAAKTIHAALDRDLIAASIAASKSFFSTGLRR